MLLAFPSQKWPESKCTRTQFWLNMISADTNDIVQVSRVVVGSPVSSPSPEPFADVTQVNKSESPKLWLEMTRVWVLNSTHTFGSTFRFSARSFAIIVNLNNSISNSNLTQNRHLPITAVQIAIILNLWSQLLNGSFLELITPCTGKLFRVFSFFASLNSSIITRILFFHDKTCQLLRVTNGWEI